MYKATALKHNLKFKKPGGTSRGILKEKLSYFIMLSKVGDSAQIGIGECGLLKGLSIDDRPDYESKLKDVCANINAYLEMNRAELENFPSIQFALEMALLDLKGGGTRSLFPSKFTEGKEAIPINGLIWMGDEGFMKEQIEEKLASGYTCLKMKIGAIDFDKEWKILKNIRSRFSPDKLELRVDANGAFSVEEAAEKLNQLSELHLHSIEQPIRQGNHEEMSRLCKTSPIAIALDEELIGVTKVENKMVLLDQIMPAYIILKPSLVGGFESCEEWIQLAQLRKINWWITSALESNIGLNAIAQWSYMLDKTTTHGLGTGQLYTNNFDSPLQIINGSLTFDPSIPWNMELLSHHASI